MNQSDLVAEVQRVEHLHRKLAAQYDAEKESGEKWAQEIQRNRDSARVLRKYIADVTNFFGSVEVEYFLRKEQQNSLNALLKDILTARNTLIENVHQANEDSIRAMTESLSMYDTVIASTPWDLAIERLQSAHILLGEADTRRAQQENELSTVQEDLRKLLEEEQYLLEEIGKAELEAEKKQQIQEMRVQEVALLRENIARMEGVQNEPQYVRLQRELASVLRDKEYMREAIQQAESELQSRTSGLPPPPPNIAKNVIIPPKPKVPVFEYTQSR